MKISRHFFGFNLVWMALLALCHNPIALAQPAVESWVQRYDGEGNNRDEPKAVAVDASGNVFVVGNSFGVGTSGDYLTIAYSSAGVPLWTNRYNGSANGSDQPYDLALDVNGNVFVTGISENKFVTISYSSSGIPLWTNLFKNRASRANAVSVDSNNSVIVAGYTDGAPGGNGSTDFATLSYSSDGTPQWTNYYIGPGHDYAEAMAVDASGNIFVTGNSVGGLSSTADYATVAYSSAGMPLWTNHYNGPGNGNDEAAAVAVDASGNVFVTGRSTGVGSLHDFATIAYSSAGVPLWTNRYNGSANSTDRANAVVVDSNGDVLVTGSANGSGSDSGFATIKYSAAGMPVWTNFFSRITNSSDAGNAVVVDAHDNVFVTGSSFDAGSSTDFATIGYSSAGVPLWTNFYNGPGNGPDISPIRKAIAVSPDGAVVVTGASDVNPASQTTYDFATVKYSYPMSPAITVQPLSQTGILASNVAIGVKAVGTPPLQSQWLFDGTPILAATNLFLNLSNVAFTNQGNYQVIITNTYGSLTSSVALLTMNLPAGSKVMSGGLLLNGDVSIALMGIPGTSYVLDRSPTLFPAAWAPQATNTPGPDGALVFTDSPVPNINNYWRVRTLP